MKMRQTRFYKQKLSQSNLAKARVLVIGAGGVGSPLITYLSRSGIGNLDIADGDTVSLSNIYRQIMFGESDVGLNKAQVCARNIKQNISIIKINTHPSLISIDDYMKLGTFDMIIDCTDNFESMLRSNKYAIATKTRFLAGSCEGEEGQVFYYDYRASHTLEKHGCLQCFFNKEVPKKEEVNYVLGPVAGIVGCYLAKEVLKLLGDENYQRSSFVSFIFGNAIREFIPQAAGNCQHLL